MGGWGGGNGDEERGLEERGRERKGGQGPGASGTIPGEFYVRHCMNDIDETDPASTTTQ